MRSAEYPDGGTPPQIHTQTTQPLPKTGTTAVQHETLWGFGFVLLGCLALVAVAKVGRRR